jgi:hypothetical protein
MLRAAMTNTGFVAPPILHFICGSGRRPAAIATVFVAARVSPYWQAKDVSQSGSSDANLLPTPVTSRAWPPPNDGSSSGSAGNGLAPNFSLID